MPTPEPEKRVKRPRLRLPFEKRKQDAGSWTYDHRIGLCVTLIAYLVLMIAFVSSKIVVGRKPHTQGMYIDLQTLAELEQPDSRPAGIDMSPAWQCRCALSLPLHRRGIECP